MRVPSWFQWCCLLNWSDSDRSPNSQRIISGSFSPERVLSGSSPHLAMTVYRRSDSYSSYTVAVLNVHMHSLGTTVSDSSIPVEDGFMMF